MSILRMIQNHHSAKRLFSLLFFFFTHSRGGEAIELHAMADGCHPLLIEHLCASRQKYTRGVLSIGAFNSSKFVNIHYPSLGTGSILTVLYSFLIEISVSFIRNVRKQQCAKAINLGAYTHHEACVKLRVTI